MLYFFEEAFSPSSLSGDGDFLFSDLVSGLFSFILSLLLTSDLLPLLSRFSLDLGELDPVRGERDRDLDLERDSVFEGDSADADRRDVRVSDLDLRSLSS